MKSTTCFIQSEKNCSPLKKYWIIALILFGSLDAYTQIGPVNYLTYRLSINYTTADLDNDGDLDVITGKNRNSELDRAFTWFENVDGTGTDWMPHEIDFPSDVENYGQIAAADVNGDGWIDIISSTHYTLIHNGNPNAISFTPVLNNMPPGSYTRLGDFDNDGNIDVLRWVTSGNIYFYRNTQQDGTFSNPFEIPLPPATPHQLVTDTKIIDVDSDNDLDIVSSIINEISDSTFIVWSENTDGLGNFEIPQLIYSYPNPSPTISRSFLSVGDFNGDGDTDVVVSKDSSIMLHVQQNGNWELQFEEPGNYGKNIEATDFDNDGDLDFIEGRNYLNDFHWFENVGNSGIFNKVSVIDSLPFAGNTQILLNDFDSDNDIDISLVNFTSANKDGIFLFKNDLNNTGNFLAPVQISDNINGPLEPYSTDLDNDSDIDVLLYSPIDQNIYWSENLGNSGEFPLPFLLIDEQDLSGVTFKDLDSDDDLDVIATSNYKLVWFENQSNSTIHFGDKQLLAIDSLNPHNLVTGDFDGDGDLDIGARTLTSKKAYWFEQQDTNTFIPHLISNDSIEYIYGFGDINKDGLEDIVYRKTNLNNNSNLCYFKQEPNGSFSSILLYNGITSHVQITDIDNDLDDDLLIKSNNFTLGLFLLLNEQDGLTELIINNDFNINDLLFINDFEVADLDYDGKKDIYAGKYWYRQLPESSFSNKLLLDENGMGGLDLNDLSGDGVKDFIYSGYGADAMVWAENQIAELSIVEGRVAIDQNFDCLLEMDIDTFGLYGWLVEFERVDTSYYSSTNTAGYYTAILPDSGEYTVRLHLPNNYWGACYEDTLLNVSPDQLSILDFQVQSEFDCPLMQIEMSSSYFRPCIDGSINIQYCNEGTILAENAQIEVLIDELLVFNDANYPYSTTDSSYIFDVGDVGILECDIINISVTPDCDSTQVGQIVCSTAYVTPDSLCAPLDSLWDGSTIEVSGFCIGDSIHFEMKNTGTGAMSEARQFRIEIVNDDIVLMILADTFQLNPEEIKTVIINSEMEALRLEADQDENHPISNTASSLVSECADFNFTINLFPENDGNPFMESNCRPITGSYDPNLKEAIPLGYGEENLIDKDWELDYTIHFQNTGNDTAFTVVLKDPISEYLDLSTLKIGSASHPFTWELNTLQRELVFTFDDILLPDSSTNEMASHGHLQFSISPFKNISFGTTIENAAAIYFDFNEPIITNQVFHTIRTPIIANSFHFDICEGEDYLDIPIFNDTLIVDSTFIVEGLQLDFNHIHSIPPSFMQIDTIVLVGTIINDVEISQDTIIETVLENSLGCDSLVLINVIASTTSVEDYLEESAIQVFPIPTKDQLTISWTGEQSCPKNLSLISSSGKLLESIIINQNALSEHQLKINIGTFPQGVYWIRIDLEEGSVYRRVVKI